MIDDLLEALIVNPLEGILSSALRKLEIVELFVEAQHAGAPHKLRRRFPLFVVATARAVALGSRLCPTCRAPVRRLGQSGPLALHCSPRCAKHGYNFNPRKRATRAAWAKRRRDRLRAQGLCLGCARPASAAYCGECR